MVEQKTVNFEATGSSPVSPAIIETRWKEAAPSRIVLTMLSGNVGSNPYRHLL